MFSVIFDMDGTLLDTQYIFIPAWDFAGKNQGYDNLGRHIPSVCGMNETGWTKYLTENFPNLDIVRFKRETTQYITERIQVRFKRGAEELIAYLRQNNIKYAIASGSSTTLINTYLKVLKAEDLFDTVIGGEMIKNGKPSPDIFLLAAEKLGTPPENCFVFEDSNNGVLAAHNAGIKCIGIPDLVDFSRETKASLYAELNNLAEAIEIFEELKK